MGQGLRRSVAIEGAYAPLSSGAELGDGAEEAMSRCCLFGIIAIVVYTTKSTRSRSSRTGLEA